MRPAFVAAPLLVAIAGLVPATAPAASASETVCVEIVVDYGRLAGAPAAPSATCVTVPGGSTGAEILAARARKLGRPAPRWENGMLCAIDGLPRTGCAESDPNGGYDYWSYWHAVDDGPWTYATRGAAAVVPDDGHHHAEGWAWIQGGAEGSRQPARVSYASVCPVAKPSTAPARAAAPARTAATAPAAPTTTSAPTHTAAPTAAAVRHARAAAAPPTSASPSPSPVLTTFAPQAAQPRGASGDPPVVPLLGAGLAVALGVAAALRARRG